LGEAEAHGAQSECRIRRDARESLERLVLLIGAEIERADRDRLVLHSLGHRAVRLELLVFGRQRIAIEEQELRAEKTNAGGTVLQRLREILRQLDVRQELDVHAVERLRGLGAQSLQLLPREVDLVLLQPVL